MAKGTLTFLGTGASTGIPVVGCPCPVCTSDNPKNKRLRCSAWIQYQNRSYIIDTSPDFRQQALNNHIKNVDGVIITHTHYDHIGGLEELRVFNFRQNKPIPCLLSEPSFQDVQKLYFYHFIQKKALDTFSSEFQFDVVTAASGDKVFDTLPVRYFRYNQGSIDVMGLRIGSLAYIADIKTYSDAIFDFLDGVETLVVTALRFSHSTFHFTIDEACDFSKRVKAKKTYFTHIAHEVDHDKVAALLPPAIELAYDGLQITFEA